MTFCIGIKVEDGLVGIADTRVTSGVEYTQARKVSTFTHNDHPMFLMTSGLRSVRDKALTYFQELMAADGHSFNKLYRAVNALADQVRQAASEDKSALSEAGLGFDLHCLIGGQLEDDEEHKLYLLYPEGNWVEVQPGTPYSMIGESSYGKPVLTRALRYESSLDLALKLGFLAFDATRNAATDVYYPIDVVLYQKNSRRILEHRFERDELDKVAAWWQKRLRSLVDRLPGDWTAPLTGQLAKTDKPAGQ
ncbi:MAG: peptidase [Phycisphaerae bacterium]